MRRLLSLDQTRHPPLMKGPYVSLSRPFRQGAAVDALVREGLFHPHMRQRIPAEITHVYGHRDVNLFADARLDFLMFDEAHTFMGAQGAETACLIRTIGRIRGLSWATERRSQTRPAAPGAPDTAPDTVRARGGAARPPGASADERDTKVLSWHAGEQNAIRGLAKLANERHPVTELVRVIETPKRLTIDTPAPRNDDALYEKRRRLTAQSTRRLTTSAASCTLAGMVAAAMNFRMTSGALQSPIIVSS